RDRWHAGPPRRREGRADRPRTVVQRRLPRHRRLPHLRSARGAAHAVRRGARRAGEELSVLADPKGPFAAEPPRARLYGVFPAVVVDVADPDGQGRVKIRLPWV